ncbi:unnamed protein product [Malus baccata var. baccata]
MSMIHPSRLGLYSHGREWAYNLIRDKLLIEAESSGTITNSPKSSECHSFDIEARHEWLTKKEMNNGFEDEECSKILSYVDTLMDLQLPDNGRKLTDDEKQKSLDLNGLWGSGMDGYYNIILLSSGNQIVFEWVL